MTNKMKIKKKLEEIQVSQTETMLVAVTD